MSTQKAKFALFTRLQDLGFSYEEAQQLRRIEMTLQRWAELECGDEHGNAIERGESVDLQLINWPDASGNVWLVEKRESGFSPIREFQTKNLNDEKANRALRREKALNIPGKPYKTFDLGQNGRRGRYPVADREAGALKRLAAIMAAHPTLWAYHQSDPRGCALYIGRKSYIPSGSSIDSCYNCGVAVCA